MKMTAENKDEGEMWMLWCIQITVRSLLYD